MAAVHGLRRYTSVLFIVLSSGVACTPSDNARSADPAGTSGVGGDSSAGVVGDAGAGASDARADGGQGRSSSVNDREPAAADSGLPDAPDVGVPADSGATPPATDAGPQVDCSEPPRFAARPLWNRFLEAEWPAGHTWDLRDPRLSMWQPRTGAPEGLRQIVLPGGEVLYLSRDRGLQIIDLSDTAAPRLVAEVAQFGWPAALYGVAQGHAIVIAYDWAANAPSVFAVDVRDTRAPRIASRLSLAAAYGGAADGLFTTAQLAADAAHATLYVALSLSYRNASGWNTEQKIVSVDTTSGALTLVDEVSLARGVHLWGYRNVPGMLALVASNEQPAEPTVLHVIDTSSPLGGPLVFGAVTLAGTSRAEQLEIRDGIAHVTSNVTLPNNTFETWVESIDVRDARQPVRIAHCLAGGSAGAADEGCYPYPSPVDEVSRSLPHAWIIDRTRLVIKQPDPRDRFDAALRLLDVSEPRVPVPVLAELHLPEGHAWQHTPLIAVEHAVSVEAGDGALETGLLLVPYRPQDVPWGDGWGVQLVTFGERTLTLRGRLEGAPVESAIALGSGVLALLSDGAVLPIDASDPDHPIAIARLDLMPEYAGVFAYGDHIARVRSSYEPVAVEVEIVAQQDDPQLGAVVARFPVPPAASLFPVGDLLVSVVPPFRTFEAITNPSHEGRVEVYDLSDPAAPVHAASLVAPDLPTEDCVRLSGSLAPPATCIGTTRVEALATSTALVFTGSWDTSRPPDEPGRLHVLDLTDPSRPELRGLALPVPCDDPATADVTIPSYSYLVTGTDLYVVWIREGIYVRRIGLSEPSRPRLDARINVPGLPFAAAGDVLYTLERLPRVPAVDANRTSDPALHRVRLRDGSAVIEDTRVFEVEYHVTALPPTAAGALAIVEWQPRPELGTSGTYIPRGDLVLLDATDLRELGRSADIVDYRGVRCIGRDPVVVEKDQDLLIVDLSGPGAPHVRHAYGGRVQSWQFGSPRHFACGAPLFVAAGRSGLRRVD